MFAGQHNGEIKMTLGDNQLIYSNDKWVSENQSKITSSGQDATLMERNLHLEAENKLLEHKLQFALDMVTHNNKLALARLDVAKLSLSK